MIGENITRIRKEKGMSLEDLAKRAHYKSTAPLSAIESGKVNPSYHKKMDIARALGVTIRELTETPYSKAGHMLISEIGEGITVLSQEQIGEIAKYAKRMIEDSAKKTEAFIVTKRLDDEYEASVTISDGKPLSFTGSTSYDAQCRALRSMIRFMVPVQTKSLAINTDSKFMVKAITWYLKGWKKNGFRTKEGEEIKNAAFWKEFAEFTEKVKIEAVLERKD